MGDSFYDSKKPYYHNGRLCAITDSEVAADALEETLFNMGLDDTYERISGVNKSGLWEARFVAKNPDPVVGFNDILLSLPISPESPNREVKYWSNGCDILCRDEESASAIADFLNEMGYEEVNTGFYDPEEDKKSGEVNECTGWYYVGIA